MRWECRERFPSHRPQREPLVSDPVIHHGTWVTHVSWCMSESLSRIGLVRSPWLYSVQGLPAVWYLLVDANAVRRSHYCLQYYLTIHIVFSIWKTVENVELKSCHSSRNDVNVTIEKTMTNDMDNYDREIDSDRDRDRQRRRLNLAVDSALKRYDFVITILMYLLTSF